MNDPRRLDQPETATGSARLADVLALWTDPEWLLFVGVLCIPALLCLALGNTLRASFFGGMAVYLGTLKWLGWLVFTRTAGRAPAFALFPAEIFVGLALACFWFYLRNLLGRVWPASYGLLELKVLAWMVIAIHLLAGMMLLMRERDPVFRSRRRLSSELFQRLAMYVPYIFVLTVIFWTVSGVLHVQTTDSILHAFSARVFKNDGLFFRNFPPTNGGWPIPYPSGFGAINTVTVAVSPLNVVQAVNMQHIVLLITGLFLITGSISMLAGRPLWLLHSLLLPLLAIFPIHGLYPYLNYEGTARQAAPALLIAVCLLPVHSKSTRWLPFLWLVGAEAMLIAITAVLNPACAIPAALAALTALAVNCYRGKLLLGQSHLRLFGVQAGFLLLTSGVVFSGDEYVRSVLGSGTPLQAAAEEGEREPEPAEQEGARGAFSVSKAFRGIVATNPIRFTSEITVAPIYDKFDIYRDWQRRWLFTFFPWLALMIDVLVVGAGVVLKREKIQVLNLNPLLWLLAACFVLWFLVKYGSAFLAHGLSFSIPATALLGSYLTFLATRFELILVFTTILAGIAVLYLVAEPHLLGVAIWRVLATVFTFPLLGFLFYSVRLSIFLQIPSSGYLMAYSFPFGASTTASDLKLVAWVNEHLPPGKGLIGLAAETEKLGQDKHEPHIYPTGGAQAMLFYSKYYNFCFTQQDPNLPYPFEDYNAHVKDALDTKWCLDNHIRYFFIPAGGPRFNPGLNAAIKNGKLKLIEASEENGGVYKIVDAEASP